MAEVKNDPALVAFCGLYCGACGKFKSGKCPGCAGNEKASWCAIRKCCMEHNYKSCADCTEFADVMECKKYNNFFSKVIGFVLRSNRKAGIERIKAIGLEAFAREMAESGQQSIKR
ncbi:DUF3795 domain-containing protein [Candidatus Falkowbacteria bacterium]|nr:DUF3795 domain-containing protein [Candidatus Falkowbacteria bacterium]